MTSATSAGSTSSGESNGTILWPDWLLADASVPPVAGHGVRIVDGLVDAVGPGDFLAATHPDDTVLELPDRVVLPGFVNAHVHMYGLLSHGIPLDAAPSGFWPFLEDFWWPKVEDRLDHTMIAAAADWACTEMLRSGTTTFLDILEAPNVLPGGLDAQAEAVRRSGMRGILSFEATERSGSEIAAAGLEENQRFVETCRTQSDDDLLSGLISIHTLFTCSDDFVRDAFVRAAELDVLVHAHCNEGVHEGEWCEAHHGHRTLEHYAALGVAGPGFLASQVVHLSEAERRIVADCGVRCSHMPLANGEVGGGIAPIPELLDAGVTVGLGSDGYVNDLYEVMRSAFLIHKARLRDPGVMDAHRVLAMATTGGAAALDLEKVGRLAPGWSADLQVVDSRFPTPVTEANLAEQLVLFRSAQHVEAVMVAGLWRVRDGRVVEVDLEEQRARLHEQALRLWSAS
ncbi:MAG: amidohydrolase [Acidimicrobiaceae bacterium]|nr:amidohydrolase [Acidimicrobiaceae bacterium]MBI00332.1 amidohydrolase [Acidimicrobiaceae bacterium]